MKDLFYSFLIKFFMDLVYEAIDLILAAIKDGSVDQLVERIDSPSLKMMIQFLLPLIVEVLEEVDKSEDSSLTKIQLKSSRIAPII